MNKKKVVGYLFIGFVSFIVLIYQTFPYAIIKENLVIEVQYLFNKSKISLNISI